MKEYEGLNKLTSVGSNVLYCNCGYELTTVNNGWFHGQVLYCEHENKVFNIQITDITKKAGEEFIESCKTDKELDDIRLKVNKKNMKEVDSLTNKE